MYISFRGEYSINIHGDDMASTWGMKEETDRAWAPAPQNGP